MAWEEPRPGSCVSSYVMLRIQDQIQVSPEKGSDFPMSHLQGFRGMELSWWDASYRVGCQSKCRPEVPLPGATVLTPGMGESC